MSRPKFLFNILICSALLITGCNKEQAKVQGPVELSKDAKAIAVALQSVDADKCATMYKQFAGLSDYMKNAGKKVDSTPKVLKIIRDFQTDYGYTVNKEDEHTKLVKAFFDSRGYTTPKKIVDSVSDDEEQAKKEISRATVVKDMQEMANAVKSAIEAKKNAK